MEKIRTDSEEFQRAVARGDRRQIEEWDAAGLIAWNPKNHVGLALSEQAQKQAKAEKQAAEDRGGGPAPEPPSRIDSMGLKPGERLWHGHPLVQSALARGDSQLLAELLADDRYDSAQPSSMSGAFTRSDSDTYFRSRDAS